MQKCLIVLGMHRSGTSAITRGFKVMGVELGDNLMPPVANENATGYWEDLDIKALNSEMLHAIGSDWHYLTPIQSDDIEVLRKKGYFLRAGKLLRKKIGESPVFGFKDPRVAKLLPFWKVVFSQCQLDVSYILTLRHPLSVVMSLAKRDGFEAEKSYLMWLGHVIVSLSETAGEKCILIDYDHLMQSPDFELKRLAKKLDLKIDSTELQNYKTAFLDKELRHTVYDLNDLLVDDACPPLVWEIYVTLMEVASNKKRVDNLSLQKKVAIWASEFERLKSPLALVDRLSIKNTAVTQALTERDAQIAALYHSTSWRITKPLRIVGYQIKRSRRVAELALPAIRRGGGLKNTVKKAIQLYRREGLAGIKRGFRVVATSWLDRNDYAEWIRRYDTPTDESRATMRARIDAFVHKPLISVVMPTYNPKPAWLIEAIESIREQIYPYWELFIADDASTDEAIRPILERYVREDKRIKVVFREKNGHISAASNSALGLATGDWVALIDHDDLLAEPALFWVADSINQNPGVCLIYSDEDKIDNSGRRFDPYFKCDWNLDLFYSHNMITHLGIYRAVLLKEIGGFREGFEGAQDYDLALRFIECIKPKQIHHIPRVLYHWRMHTESTAKSGDVKPYALLAGKIALNEHLQRQGVDATAELLNFGMYRIKYTLPDRLPLVSLIIPTRNELQLIKNCIESILKKTTYPNYEILIVDNGSDNPAAIRYFENLRSDARVKVVRDERPFNYSALNNAAVKLVRGEIVGLLNNDLEVVSAEWLSEMVSHALRPGVGAVGARLWYSDNTLQHGGVIVGLGGVAGHSYKHLPQGMSGYFWRANLIQNYSAVTAACLVIRKSIYEEVGGFNEDDLQVAFNDVDFCLRVGRAGYRNIWTPYAELYHHESATRGFEDTPEKQARFAKEVQWIKKRWGDKLLDDPAYSPNLTLDHEDFSLAWPPRVELWPTAKSSS